MFRTVLWKRIGMLVVVTVGLWASGAWAQDVTIKNKKRVDRGKYELEVEIDNTAGTVPVCALELQMDNSTKDRITSTLVPANWGPFSPQNQFQGQHIAGFVATAPRGGSCVPKGVNGKLDGFKIQVLGLPSYMIHACLVAENGAVIQCLVKVVNFP